jgi:hypothetical protein
VVKAYRKMHRKAGKVLRRPGLKMMLKIISITSYHRHYWRCDSSCLYLVNGIAHMGFEKSFLPILYLMAHGCANYSGQMLFFRGILKFTKIFLTNYSTTTTSALKGREKINL